MLVEGEGMSEWSKGYDQAIQEVLDEVAERSPTMASAIMNRYPVWKAIMQARESQLPLSGRSPK